MGKTQQLGIAMYLKCKGNFSFFLEGGGQDGDSWQTKFNYWNTVFIKFIYIYHVHIAELMMLQSLSPCQVLKNASELPVSCHRWIIMLYGSQSSFF